MSLPFHAFTLHGGCLCRAVRYTLSIPAVAARPRDAPVPDPTDDPQALPRYPLLEIDHCADCRRATGAVFCAWLLVPIGYVELALRPRPAAPSALPSSADAPPSPEGGRVAAPSGGAPLGAATSPSDRDARVTVAAEAALRPGGAAHDGRTALAAHASSPGVWRTFCAVCGSSVSYTKLGAEGAGVAEPDRVTTFDVLLGTVDEVDLARERIRPARHIYWGEGVDWMRKMAEEGDGGLVRCRGGGSGQGGMQDAAVELA